MPMSAGQSVLRAGAVSVRRLGEPGVTESAWQDYAGRTKASTFYHDLAWRHVFQGAFGYRSHCLAALDDQTGTIRGILPLYAVRGLTGAVRLVAVPFRDRGGIVCDDGVAFRALIAEAEALRRQMGAAQVEIKTVIPYERALVDDAGLHETMHWVRSVVDLEWVRAKGLGRATAFKRGVVRQAEQAGLSFEDATGKPSAVDDWYAVHQHSQRALGLPPFPRRFFAALFDAPFRLGAVKLCLVHDPEKRVVAGTILFLRQPEAIYAYSASRPEARQLRPNDLMLFRVLAMLVELGYSSFDMGSDAPAQQGLLHFKRQWLAEQAPIPTYYLGETRIAADSSDRRFALARTIARHLPLPLARGVLAPVVRFLG
jgi:hypothetical protein